MNHFLCILILKFIVILTIKSTHFADFEQVIIKISHFADFEHATVKITHFADLYQEQE